MKVEYGTSLDIESWMELVQSVSWNFPGLETEVAIEDHRQTVLRFMGENRALCVKDAVNFGLRATSARSFSHAISGK